MSARQSLQTAARCCRTDCTSSLYLWALLKCRLQDAGGGKC